MERSKKTDKDCFFISEIAKESFIQSVELVVDMVKENDNVMPVPDYVGTNVST